MEQEILIYLVGFIASYALLKLCRDYLNQNTIGDVYFTIILSLFSWICVLSVLVIMLVVTIITILDFLGLSPDKKAPKFL